MRKRGIRNRRVQQTFPSIHTSIHPSQSIDPLHQLPDQLLAPGITHRGYTHTHPTTKFFPSPSPLSSPKQSKVTNERTHLPPHLPTYLPNEPSTHPSIHPSIPGSQLKKITYRLFIEAKRFTVQHVKVGRAVYHGTI